jgi:hypothetical protein
MVFRHAQIPTRSHCCLIKSGGSRSSVAPWPIEPPIDLALDVHGPCFGTERPCVCTVCSSRSSPAECILRGAWIQSTGIAGISTLKSRTAQSGAEDLKPDGIHLRDPIRLSEISRTVTASSHASWSWSARHSCLLSDSQAAGPVMHVEQHCRVRAVSAGGPFNMRAGCNYTYKDLSESQVCPCPLALVPTPMMN